jgi:hypothetical protein
VEAKTTLRQAMLKVKKKLGALFFEREGSSQRTTLVALLSLENTCCLLVGLPLKHLAKPVFIAPLRGNGARYQRLSKI